MRHRNQSSDEIVRSTLTEIMMVFVFFLLVALATLTLSEQGTANGVAQSDSPDDTVPGEKYRRLLAMFNNLKDENQLLAGEVVNAEQIVVILQGELTEAENRLLILGTESGRLAKENEDLTGQVEELKGLVISLEGEVEDLTVIIAGLRKQAEPSGEPEIEEPVYDPVIEFTDAGQYFFRSGSAEVNGEFDKFVRDKIVSEIRKYAATTPFDTIDVIGHTDGDPVSQSRRSTNLDSFLVAALRGEIATDVLEFEDNAGLGLARAAAISSILRDVFQKENFRIQAYSAGQAILRDGRLTASNDRADLPDRRRIEIRLRRWPGNKSEDAQ
jgi:flagellar motor protein MotB